MVGGGGWISSRSGWLLELLTELKITKAVILGPGIYSLNVNFLTLHLCVQSFSGKEEDPFLPGYALTMEGNVFR